MQAHDWRIRKTKSQHTGRNATVSVVRLFIDIYIVKYIVKCEPVTFPSRQPELSDVAIDYYKGNKSDIRGGERKREGKKTITIFFS